MKKPSILKLSKILFITIILLVGYVCLFAQGPAWQWANTASSVHSSYGYGIAIDHEGNIYVTGTFHETIRFTQEIILTTGQYGVPKLFVAKMNNQGEWLWARNADGTSANHGYGIAVDLEGNVYVTGHFLGGSAQFGDANLQAPWHHTRSFMAKINSEGDWIWAKQSDGDDRNWGHDVTVDVSGNVYLAVVFQGTISFGEDISLISTGFRDICIVKLDNNGEWIWAKRAGGTDNYYSFVSGIAVDSDGNTYITGNFDNTIHFGTVQLQSAGTDTYVAKLDAQGDWIWAKQARGSGNSRGSGIALDDEDKVYIIGNFRGTVNFGSENELHSTGESDNIYIAKIDSEGEWIWAACSGGTGYSDRARGIAVDNEGNSYITGSFFHNVNFGDIELVGEETYNLFAAKANNDGEWDWAYTATGIAENHASSIAVDDYGNCFVIGHFTQNIAFGDIEKQSAGHEDVFVAKLGFLEFDGGDGSENNPWQIRTVAHLDNVRNYVGEEHDDKHFVQVANIDLSGEFEEDGAFYNDGEGWIPLGSRDDYFFGSYNGDEHEINGLYINRPNGDFQALFGYTKNAVITNLGLTNVDITAQTIVGSLVGAQGSNVGDNNGTIDGCYASGTIDGYSIVGGLVGQTYDPINNSYTDVTINGQNMWLGGLAGQNYRDIDNCYAVGNVSGTASSWYVGGLAGYNHRGLIKDSYASGNVYGLRSTGGLVGDGGGNLISCFATGNVTGLGDYSFDIGGLMGGSGAEIDKSFATGRVQGADYAGGLIGRTTTHAIIRNSYARGNVIPDPDYEWNNGLGGLIGNNRAQVINCYSTGFVDGYDDIGGLIGYNVVDDEAITNSYWDINTSGQEESAGGKGRYTDDMTYPYSANTYVDWGFDEIWVEDVDRMVNDGYPYLAEEEEVSVEDNKMAKAPQSLMLTNYPNPFNTETTIEFELSVDKFVRLTIFDVKGKIIRTLVDDQMQPGIQRVIWDGKNKKDVIVPSGLYLYKLETPTMSKAKKMILLK